MFNQNKEVQPLSGEATIRTISGIHQRIVSLLLQGGPLALDLSGVTEADLTLVQVIESARLSAGKRGQRLSVLGSAGGPVRALLERGGFLSRTGEAGFWLGGREPGDG